MKITIFYGDSLWLLSLIKDFTDFAVALLIGLPPKGFAARGTRESTAVAVFFFLVSCQTSFLLEGLFALRTAEGFEERGMIAFQVKFLIPFQGEGLVTLSTFPPFLFGGSMGLLNMTQHIYHSFELLATMVAGMGFPGWLLVGVCDRDLMYFSHVSLEFVAGYDSLALATFDHCR